MEAAFVDVEVDIPFLKIRGAGFPDLGIRVEPFDLLPRGKADALAMNIGRNEKQFQFVVLCFFVDFQYKAADNFAVLPDAVGNAAVDTLLNCPTGDNLAVVVNVVVTKPEFLNSTVFEGILIVENELIAVISGK